MTIDTCMHKKVAKTYYAKCFSPIRAALDSDSRQFFSNDLSCRCLAELEEARGYLQEITCADGCALASFEWGSVAFPEELEPRLRGMVGQVVAVLRLDGRYHCREC